MLLNENSSVVVACYARTQANGSAGVGAAAGEIRRLSERSAAALALGGRSSLLPPGLGCRYGDDALPSRHCRIRPPAMLGRLRLFELFLKLRPRSAIGYRESAGQAWAQNNPDRALGLYAKAWRSSRRWFPPGFSTASSCTERLMPGMHWSTFVTCGSTADAIVPPP
jgi:hypothetical protein